MMNPRRLALGMAILGLVASVPATFLATMTQEPRFRHENHASIVCGECHANGIATLSSQADWCADCHHVSADPGECGRCHGAGQQSTGVLRVLQTFRLSVGEPRTRSLLFDHALHPELICSECHTGGASPSVDRQCESCHEEHHRSDADCSACHPPPPADAHPLEVHLRSCMGAGCHAGEGADYGAVEGTRTLCLACHHEQTDHEPGEECTRCHVMGSEGGGRASARSR